MEETAPGKAAREDGRASAILLVVTLLWGLSFPLTKSWQDAAKGCPGGKILATLTVIALRMLLAGGLLAMCQPRLLIGATRQGHRAGALLGAVFFVGFVLQTLGLAYTTPALSAFFTSLGSAWVPILAWVWWRQALSLLTLLGLALGLGGCALLVEGGWNLAIGEGLTLAASVIFAAELLLLDRLGRQMDPAQFSIAFFGTIGLLGLASAALAALKGPGWASWTHWTIEMVSNPTIARNLVLLVIFPTVLSFHWMNTYQPRVSPPRAALIYLLEPVFTSVVSVLWGFDRLTGALVGGGLLILIGNLLVEIPRGLYLWAGKEYRVRSVADSRVKR
jgi:drug/metabolite transporter (DMT)-like permease